ncbi:MAG: hypothetical protein U9Q15_04650 [Patescibacteria group bacterium]|nr:hypothetical protein [Patescibacteria group bacterium]
MKNTAYIVFFSIVFGAIGGGTSSQVITPITQKFFSEETQEIAHESDTVAIYQDMIESITHEIETNIKESISDIDYQDYQQQMIDAVQNAQDSVVSIVATKDVQIIQQNPFLMDPFFQQFFQIPGDQLLPEGAQ